MRIVCLSDGCDVGSDLAAWRVAKKMQEKKIIMDLITIGDEEDLDAHGIARWGPKCLIVLCEPVTTNGLAPDGKSCITSGPGEP